jgi:MSHA biogenesis protein MshN
MLKDLDQRQGEQQGAGSINVPVNQTTSSRKVLFITLAVIVLLNVVGIFVWQLYSENQRLKATETLSGTALVEGLSQAVKSKKIAKLIEESTPPTMTVNKVAEPVNVSTTPVNKAPSLAKQTQAASIAANKIKQLNELQAEPIDKTTVLHSDKKHDSVKSNTQSPVITPINKSPAKLSISRKQLTPKALAAKKVKRAEQALANNKITEAEHLFEDVLLILPEHKSARKQLAALWYGRESYQPALNLLSQGLQLSPDDSELRLMKARIYLNRNNSKNALKTLQVLPNVEKIEYQTLLATVAQKEGQYEIAVHAYQLLTKLEPMVGRWWLGLAVAYDSNSEFTQAINMYQIAINQMDLSDSAEQFSRQRISELGE